MVTYQVHKTPNCWWLIVLWIHWNHYLRPTIHLSKFALFPSPVENFANCAFGTIHVWNIRYIENLLILINTLKKKVSKRPLSAGFRRISNPNSFILYQKFGNNFSYTLASMIKKNRELKKIHLEYNILKKLS